MTIAASEHSVSFWSLTSRDRGQLLAALLVGLLLVLPLALKVPMFIDDFGRSLSGSYDWSKDGRPLAELIYQTLMLGADRVVLTSPLGQLLCLPGMALSSLLLCRIVGHRAVWAGALATIFLFGQPYALQTLSYSFDSPLMVFAVLLSLAAGACLVLGRPTLSGCGCGARGVLVGHISACQLCILDRGVNGFALSPCASTAAGVEGVGRLGGLSIVGLIDLQIRPI